MADKKISELTELTTPDGTEELVVNDSGVSKKVQIDNLLAGGTISNFTSTGIDDNATSTAITIDASENVGIGTNSPGVNLHVKSASYPYLRVTNDGYTGLDIGQANSGAGGAGLIKLRDSAPMMFYTADLERMRITSTGDVEVETGNLVIGTSGKGIDFSAATPDGTGSTSSEVLDDYETGTWTPVLDGHVTTGTATYAYQVGIYTKVGRNVHVQGRINTTALGTIAGGLKITGLPFIINTTSGIFGSLEVGYAAGLALTAGQNVTGNADTGNTFINLRVWDATTGTGGLTSTQFSADGDIIFSMSYQTT